MVNCTKLILLATQHNLQSFWFCPRYTLLSTKNKLCLSSIFWWKLPLFIVTMRHSVHRHSQRMYKIQTAHFLHLFFTECSRFYSEKIEVETNKNTFQFRTKSYARVTTLLTVTHATNRSTKTTHATRPSFARFLKSQLGREKIEPTAGGKLPIQPDRTTNSLVWRMDTKYQFWWTESLSNQQFCCQNI